jgi:hypothetical protein
MKTKEYTEYLRGQDVPEDAIEKRLAIIGDFVKFLAGPGLKEDMAAAGKEEVERSISPKFPTMPSVIFTKPTLR